MSINTSLASALSPGQTLQYELRVRPRQVAIAIVAAVGLMAAAIITLTGPHARVNEATVDLLVANKRYPLDLIAAVINALAYLATAWTLIGIHRSARVRNPDRVQPWIKYIAGVGGVAAAVGGIAYAVLFAHAVHLFATTGQQTYAEATHLSGGGALIAFQLVDLAAALLIALSFVIVSLQAMNQGLLSRFMGYLGMFAGALVLFQITQVPVVQCYWLLALAYLLSGRWPTGMPPAWSSGKAEPWPSASEVRTRRAAEAAGRGRGARAGRAGAAGAAGAAGGRPAGGGLLGSLLGRPAPAPAPSPAPPAAPPAEGRTRSTTPKRKRKRRN